MRYRELLEQYKKDALDEHQKAQVEQDIERHEAISEYLMEEGTIPEVEELLLKTEPNERDQEEDFVKMINHSIHRAFLKLGVIVLCLAVLIMIFMQIVLPQIISSFYYNPNEAVSDNVNRMSLDMNVYTELLYPFRNYDLVIVDDNRYGKYDITLQNKISVPGLNDSIISGKVTRGELKLYNENILQMVPSNYFAWGQVVGDLSLSLEELEKQQAGEEESMWIWSGNTQEQATETLETLNDGEMYLCYVSLNQMMGYESFYQYYKETGRSEEVLLPWCAVKLSDFSTWYSSDEEDMQYYSADMIGFHMYVNTTSDISDEAEKYPELILGGYNGSYTDEECDTQAEEALLASVEGLSSETYMRHHLVSLLTYLSDQEQFTDMMGLSQDDLLEKVEYAKDNELTVYGFAAVMSKETAIAFAQDEEVYGIVTEPLNR